MIVSGQSGTVATQEAPKSNQSREANFQQRKTSIEKKIKKYFESPRCGCGAIHRVAYRGDKIANLRRANFVEVAAPFFLDAFSLAFFRVFLRARES